jgi:lysylphosphatidylglycerol synthetase-like protein (DUF2156 family)
MHGKNVVFAIVAPLVLMIIIAAIVVTIGESLLAIHAWAHAAYDVEANPEAAEQANLFPVGLALLGALVILLGGSIASRLAPQRAPHDTHH